MLNWVRFYQKIDDFGDLEVPFLGPLGTVLVILGPKGAPKRHTEAQMSIFIDFRVDFTCLLGPTLVTIL